MRIINHIFSLAPKRRFQSDVLAMAGRNTRPRSSESSGPGDAALEAQTRILRVCRWITHIIAKETRKEQSIDTIKLKKDRDENIKAATADFDAALAELRAKAIAWQEDLQRQR